MARYGGPSLSNVVGFYLERIRFLDTSCIGKSQAMAFK
jgi:hypothetical protein